MAEFRGNFGVGNRRSQSDQDFVTNEQLDPLLNRKADISEIEMMNKRFKDQQDLIDRIIKVVGPV